MSYILAIDQSTSASKALLFDQEGNLHDKVSLNHQQIYPQPGWVEHNAEEIYQNVVISIRQLLQQNPGIEDDLLCLSITNQRETILVFDRETGKPIHNAIVWQCRRGNNICAELISKGKNDLVQSKTGLPIDTYFSASKIKWLVETHPDIKQKLIDGKALIGTVEAYLIYRLTKGTVFASDQTNACRTLLYNIHKGQWDKELCDLFNVPIKALPEVKESSAEFGQTDIEELLPTPVTICGVMGDSQAALFAQRCFQPGSAKVTLGSGSSVLLNTGEQATSPKNGIVTTMAWSLNQMPTYAKEGIINFTGSTIAWLRDQLGVISDVSETEKIAQSVENNGGVYLVPAFVGLSAPYWRPDSKAAVFGLTPDSTKAHLIRAALEAITYRIRDVLDLMIADAGVEMQFLHADGGMVNNHFLMQFMADILRITVRASNLPELSALGAVFSGLLGMGTTTSLDNLEKLAMGSVDYEPRMEPDKAEKYYQGWQDAVNTLLSR